MFIPTTTILDVSELEAADVKSKEFKELIIRLAIAFNNMATIVNLKDTGIYSTQELTCGRTYYPKPGLTSSSSKTPKMRQVTRKVINWGKPLPNGSMDSVAHNLVFDANTVVTNISATANDPAIRRYITIPFISCKEGSIGIWATGTDVVIDCCGFDASGFTITNVVIEYLKF
jgi:hypothetical protein